MKPGQMVEHMDKCFKFKETKVEMSKKRKNISNFINYSQKLEVPYFIYADFESVLKKESEKKTIYEIPGYFLCAKSSR